MSQEQESHVPEQSLEEQEKEELIICDKIVEADRQALIKEYEELEESQKKRKGE